jgi:hypothetical protein
MRLRQLSYKSLMILYGACALVLSPFAFAYAYGRLHGWNQPFVFSILFVLGIGAALLTWASLERKVTSQAREPNFDTGGSVTIFSGALAATVAVGVFVPPQTIFVRCPASKTTRIASSSSFFIAADGVQSVASAYLIAS